MNKELALKKALGEPLFQHIRDFFQIIEEQDASAIVYISKKCYSLYREYAELLTPVGDKLHCSDIMMLDVAVQYRKKKVILVDDVLIHGRTLNHLKEFLEGYGCIVELYAFVINISTPVAEEEDEDRLEERKELVNIKDIVKYYFKCNAYEWKKISDLIMHSFWATNTPYCADAPMVILNGAGKEKLLATEDTFFDVRECDTRSIGRMGQRFKYYYSDFESELFSMILCVHMNQDEAVWLPNPVFFSQGKKSVHRQKNFYKEVLGDKAKELIADLEMNGKSVNEERSVFQSRFFFYMASYILMGEFIQTVKLTEDMFDVDHTNLHYSFGARFAKYFDESLWNKKNSECVYELLRSEVQSDVTTTEIDSLLCTEVEKAAKNTLELYGDLQSCSEDEREKRCAHVFGRYYKINGNIDEESAYKDKQRIAGLPALQLVQQVKRLTKYVFRDVMTAFFNQYYLGFSTLTYKVQNGSINCYSCAGEQSYKCVVHEFVIPVYFSYRYRQLFTNRFADRLMGVYLFKAEEIYERYGIPFKARDFKTYSRGASENIYDEVTILQHSEECKDEGGSELLELGYRLENFARSQDNICTDTVEDLCEKFNRWCFN